MCEEQNHGASPCGPRGAEGLRGHGHVILSQLWDGLPVWSHDIMTSNRIT